MSQKALVLIAGALTAFVLVIVGGVSARVASASAASPATDAAVSSAAWSQREAEYQTLIQQANQQLQDAYARIASMSPQAPATSVPTGPKVVFTPADAAGVALQAVPGSKLKRTPELVEYQGTLAYEVHTTAGLFYIDADTGAILYSGAAASSYSASAPSSSSPSSSYHESEDNHSSGGDD
jgi:uncharacterized membrane protein YkoI